MQTHPPYFSVQRFLLALTLGTVLYSGLAIASSHTVTPIKHLVVIFQENVSFDHYFATYPHATNPPGEPVFIASPATPSVNGLSSALMQHNPNAASPFRLDRSQAITCDMDHGYTAEQQAADAGLMDQFVERTGATRYGCDPKQVMGYYDGNTVTALWHYAQRFAMSDNSYGTTFGPSSPGALNLVSGQTHGVTPANLPGITTHGTVIGDANPAYDDCSKGAKLAMHGKNIGNLLNAKKITWGWFQGGFRPTAVKDGRAVCGAKSKNISGRRVSDYSPHHEAFQYYASTANPHHLPPSTIKKIGETDQANHQYDLRDFWEAADSGHLPSVSFLKAKKTQDGHAGYSDPLDEQVFLVNTINHLQKLPTWRHTAVIIAYDDSDGWYDHVLAPIVNHSSSAADALSGPGHCGNAKPGAYPSRCGYGPRLPLLVISPWAKRNFVDHQVTDQTSILRFIEDNWKLGRLGNQSFDALAGSLDNAFNFKRAHSAPLILNPKTGEPLRRHRS